MNNMSLTPEEISGLMDKYCKTQKDLSEGINYSTASVSLYMQKKAGPRSRVGQRAYHYFERIREECDGKSILPT